MSAARHDVVAHCATCAAPFSRGADEPWKRRCLSCWKATRGRGEAIELQREIAGLRGELAAANALVSMLQRRHAGEVRMLRLELAAARLGGAGSNAGVADELRENLPRLVRLCHPDRHEGSVAANQATAWLLGLRRRLGAAA